MGQIPKFFQKFDLKAPLIGLNRRFLLKAIVMLVQFKNDERSSDKASGRGDDLFQGVLMSINEADLAVIHFKWRDIGV